jgi:hypothetical protein
MVRFVGSAGDADGDVLETIEEIEGSNFGDTFYWAASSTEDPVVPLNWLASTEIHGRGGEDTLSISAGLYGSYVTFYGGSGGDHLIVDASTGEGNIYVDYFGREGADDFQINNVVEGSGPNVSVTISDADSEDRGYVNGNSIAIDFNEITHAFEFWQQIEGEWVFSYNYGADWRIDYYSDEQALYYNGYGVDVTIEGFESGDYGIVLPPMSPQGAQSNFVPLLVSEFDDGPASSRDAVMMTDTDLPLDFDFDTVLADIQLHDDLAQHAWV